jgi:hypothetical protein
MPRQQSLLADYISVILRTIESTKRDPAQLRSLVYELARLSLGKQILQHYSEMGADGLQKHMTELETAIRQVEIHSRNDLETLAPPAGFHPEMPEPPSVRDAEVFAPPSDRSSEILDPPLEPQLIEGLAHPFDQSALVIHDPTNNDDTTDEQWINPPLMIYNDLSEIYSGHLLPGYSDSEPPAEPVQIIEWVPNHDRPKLWLMLQMTGAAFLGAAIFVALTGRAEISDTLNRLRSGGPAPVAHEQLATRNEVPAKPVAAARTQPLGFDLPTSYGVYAVNGGKLIELGALPIRVPDPRIAISAIISKPSAATIPNGKLAFVVFRRDLMSSAPDMVSVRVVARVMRELKFGANGPATTTKVEDQWAVRNKSYEFKVSPLADNPEMIVIRPADPTTALPAGRYALDLKAQAYDFNVDGPIKDAAQCLERTNALGGEVYSECRNP